MKIGINGFGRIGRAIYRINLSHEKHFDVPIINDINPDPSNVAYQLNYDSTYGNLSDKFIAKGTVLSNSSTEVLVSNKPYIDEVEWNQYGIEVIVDASGKKENVLRARKAIEKNESVKKVIITHCPKDVDFTMVIGVNEDSLSVDYDVISSSICDATAIAPVLKLMYEKLKVKNASITTVHPILSYQNVLDGASVSWYDPSKTYTHYALGRSVFDTIIPKPTTAIEETCKVLGIDSSTVAHFSYRIPTTIVGSADVTLFLENDTTKDIVNGILEEYVSNQNYKIMKVNTDPLISIDLKKCEYSVVVDKRWTCVADGKIVKLVLWYDNEWGYSSRVIDQLKIIENMLSRRMDK